MTVVEVSGAARVHPKSWSPFGAAAWAGATATATRAPAHPITLRAVMSHLRVPALSVRKRSAGFRFRPEGGNSGLFINYLSLSLVCGSHPAGKGIPYPMKKRATSEEVGIAK